MRVLWQLLVAVPATLTLACGSSAFVCDNDALVGGCVQGRCRIHTTARPLPDGGVASVSEVPVPPELSGDPVGDSVCQVSLPNGTDQGADIQLEIAFGTGLPPDAILFEEIYAGAGRKLGSTTSTSGTVSGNIHTSGIYGLTRPPAAWSIDQVFGVDMVTAVDEPTMLRNVATHPTTTATFDGKHLLIGNGNRTLVFDSLTPTPATLPSLVVGQPDVNHTLAQTTGAITNGAVQGMWSDGTRLAIAQGNRILIWESFPTTSLQPADIVLGQPDFISNGANTGGISAWTLNAPSQVDSNGASLIVADSLNERVLVWNGFPSVSMQPADFVIGQPDFHSNMTYAGATPLYIPYGAMLGAAGAFVSSFGGPFSFTGPVTASNPPSTTVFGWQLGPPSVGTRVVRSAFAVAGPSGGIAERDIGLMRVNVLKTAATSAATADFQLGQPDPTRSVGLTWADASYVDPGRVCASAFGNFPALGAGGDALLLPDGRRALIWEHFPSYHYEPATYVFGQPGFATNESADFRTVGAATFASPADASTAGGVTAIADKGNNRILLFKTAQLTTPYVSAYAAVGQPDLRSYTANGDLRSPTLATLSGPEGVCVDGTHLIVADTENHRVLIWNSVPSASGSPADVVLGQASPTATRPNRGRGDVSPADGYSDADLDGFFYPTSVACDGAHLAVSDRLNHRVLVWATFPTSARVPDMLIGQASPTSVVANRNQGWQNVVPDGLDMPTGIAFEGTSLWVADTENNRVVRWDNVFVSPSPGAFLGQPDGNTITNWNYVLTPTFAGDVPSPTPSTTMTSIIRPRAVVSISGRLFVSELDSNRVHVFDEGSTLPVAVLGQPDEVTASLHTNGVTAATLGEPGGLSSDGSNLLVVDTRAHRLLGFPLSSVVAGASASFVIGQPTFASSGFNATSQAGPGIVSAPHGLAMHGGVVYVSDTNNNRVIATDVSQAPWNQIDVYGQPDFSLALPNAGGSASASTLVGPRGLFVDDSRVVIADTGNNRVLFFPAPASGMSGVMASVVLGQADMSSTNPNAGGASLSTLQFPNGVCSDGSHVVVADTSNHRVLVWNGASAMNGQPADVVLGQSDGASIQPNRGTGIASSTTMSYPSACLIWEGTLYVADTGNNRLLVFDAIPTASGAAANAVVGQADFTRRVPAATVDDLSRMAGPNGLSTDSANLYVTDRDLGRVVVVVRGADSRFSVPDAVLGGTITSTLHASGGLTATRTPLFTTTLYVSDTNGSQVPRVVSVSRLIDQ